MKLVKHLKTICKHKKYVFEECVKMGIIWQGLLHDLSKFSIAELSICKYYDGTRSPHQVAREQIGYSPSWIHHYHLNKHHFQYWWDEDEDGKIIPLKMPYKYVIESFCDMIGASKAYGNYSKEAPLNYYNTKCQNRIMHKDSKMLLETLLKAYANENDFYKWYKLHKKELKESY